jgi:hypothetical protein
VGPHRRIPGQEGRRGPQLQAQPQPVPGRSRHRLFLEEAAIAFLDAADNPPAEEEAATEEESFDFGSSDEESTEETTEETTEESSDDEFSFDLDTESTEEEG